MSDGQSHLIIGSIWNSCGKGLTQVRWLVRWARWREVTSAACCCYCYYYTAAATIMMLIALTYCWPAVCQIILHVSSNLSLTSILKARLPISKMSFREMLFNQCFHLWLCSLRRRGTIHIVHVRNCVFITTAFQEIAVKYHKEGHSFHLYKGNI